jgi:peptidoglycan/LPS O-acetylase OafA/YrhL
MYPHLRRLTPLRFVAAIIVVIFHFGKDVPAFNNGWLQVVAQQGYIGVSFFFCLSGFIMGTIYGKRMNRFEKAEYWLSRVARIYPVYVLGLALAIMSQWKPGISAVILSSFALQAYVPGYSLTLNAPGWSLSVEMFFYLLFPFLAVGLTKSNLRFTAIAAILLWVASQILTAYLFRFHYTGYPSKSHDFIFYFPAMHLSEFVLGAVTGAAFSPSVKKWKVGLGCVAAFALVSIVVGLFPKFSLIPFPQNGLYAPIFLALICTLVSLPKIGLLENRQLITLGEASYAIYILQFPIISTLERYLRESAPWLTAGENFCICVAVLVSVSLAIYFMFERPIRGYIKRTLRPILLAHFDHPVIADPVPFAKLPRHAR